MKENFERYSPEKAQEEADLLRQKVESDKLKNYDEAEKLIEKECLDKFLSEEVYPTLNIDSPSKNKDIYGREERMDNFDEFKGTISARSSNNIQILTQRFFAKSKEIDKQNFSSVEGKRKLLNLLTEELKVVSETATVTYNVNEQSLWQILKEKQIKATSQVEKEGKETYRSKSFSKGKPYSYWRDKCEQYMGIPEGVHPVYAALASDSFDSFDVKYGAAPFYGQIFLRLKNENIKEHTVFTVGDSLALKPVELNTALLEPLRPDEARDPRVWDKESARVVQNRQLTWSHALLAKAIYNLYYRLTKRPDQEYSSSKISYIEAQILKPVSLDDIESINVPDKTEALKAEIKRRTRKYGYEESPEVKVAKNDLRDFDQLKSKLKLLQEKMNIPVEFRS